MKRKEFIVTIEGVIVSRKTTWNAAMQVMPREVRKRQPDGGRCERQTIATLKDDSGLRHTFGIFEWSSAEHPRIYRFTIERTK